MIAWIMLTELNCQSATHVKMSLYSIIFMHYFILLIMLAMSAYGLISSISIMLKLPYLNYSKSLTMPTLNFPKGSFGQKKPVHCSFQGKWCELSGVGFTMVKHKIQFFILSVLCGTPMCLWLHFKYFTLFDIATLYHECMNTASYSTGLCTNVQLWKYS